MIEKEKINSVIRRRRPFGNEPRGEVIQIGNDAFLNNKAASAPCVNDTEKSMQWAKARCYHVWIATLTLAMTRKKRK
ncbi:hypothetical protein [Brachyspira sp.]|uniref:hypothetical protein n=1 Tax=Brachyspira sp. TaxID=1977261 RepID=UPI003D7CDF41